MKNNQLQKFDGYPNFGVGFSSINDMFADFFDWPWSTTYRRQELNQDENNYFISVDLPGFKRENVKVSAENNTLKILAENGKTQYARAFSLNNWLLDKTDVKLQDGVLSLTVPKNPQSKERFIEVK